MDDGRWTMDDGRWTMDDGRWTTDNERWTTNDGRWAVSRRHRALTTDFQQLAGRCPAHWLVDNEWERPPAGWSATDRYESRTGRGRLEWVRESAGEREGKE